MVSSPARLPPPPCRARLDHVGNPRALTTKLLEVLPVCPEALQVGERACRCTTRQAGVGMLGLPSSGLSRRLAEPPRAVRLPRHRCP